MNETPAYDEAYLEKTLHRVFEDSDLFHLPRGVFRHDYDTTHAWRVNITRDKAKFLEYYYDDEAGSIENGLRLAILYRHEILSSFPMTLAVDFRRAIPQEPELRIDRKSELGMGSRYEYWHATWHDAQYRRKTKSFSVRKFGEEGARLLALEAATRNHNPIPKTYLQPDTQATAKWTSLERDEVRRNASTTYYTNGRRNQAQRAEDSYPFAYEGERHAQMHLAIERDRAFRNRKVEQFLAVHGRLFCELCSFNFLSAYPFLARDVIEVHHVLPLAELNSSTRVTFEDLMLLCSNCHTAIHQGDAVENLALARLQFASR